MSQPLSLKEAERKAFKSTFQDGLWDIYLSLIFMGFAFGAFLDTLGVSEAGTMIIWMSYVLLAFLLMWIGKRFVTVLRIGLVKFGPTRKARLMKIRTVLLASVVLGLIVWIAFALGSDNLSAGLMLGIFALNILVVFGLMAYFMDFERLYIYAVLYALSKPVGELLAEYAGLPNPTYTFLVTGGASVIVGIVLFVRFLRDYPVPENLPWEKAADDPAQ
jgi:hypothetical protein